MQNPQISNINGFAATVFHRLQSAFWAAELKGISIVTMKFEHSTWRFKAPGEIPSRVIREVFDLILKIAAQGPFQDILEDFKSSFAGKSTSYSSDAGWAETDLLRYMQEAGENAPLFIAAFVDGCASLAKEGKDVPNIDILNEILMKHDAGYQVVGDTVVSTKKPIPEPVKKVVAPAIVKNVVKPDIIIPGAQVQKGTLKAFLCHSSGDKPEVKKLYKSLKTDGFDPWLDAVNLLPGEEWEAEIKQAVKDTHVVIVCLSETAVTKAGFAQKEIKFALDVADEQPEGTIFIIPARLEDCKVPNRLSKWHWVNLFEDGGYQMLVAALKKRAATLS